MPDTFTDHLLVTNMENGSHDNTWGDVINANNDIFDAKLGATMAIVTTGGTTILTTDEERVAIIEVTGTLASNAVIQLSGRGGTWLVKNGTTGAFTLTLKLSTSSGAAIPQGSTSVIYCNGVNIIDSTASVYRIGGTDVAVADGGTGASTPAGARTNLGLGTAAVKNTGTSGDAVPLLNAGAIFSAGISVEAPAGAGWLFHIKATDKTALSSSWISQYHFDGNGQIAGSITCESGGPDLPGSSSYNTSSDGRFKEGQRPLDDWEEIIDALAPKYWRWGGAGPEDFGLVAQEVYAIRQLSHVVVKGDDNPTIGGEGYMPWMMQKGALEGVALAACKGLLRRVRELEARIRE